MSIEHFPNDKDLAEKDLDQAISLYGLDAIINAYGIDEFIRQFGPLAIIKNYTPEQVIALFGEDAKNAVESIIRDVRQKHGVDALRNLETQSESAIFGNIDRLIKKYHIDRLVNAYQKGVYNKVQLLNQLHLIEKKHKHANWSIGFSLDGDRLLVRTPFEKRVYHLDSPDSGFTQSVVSTTEQEPLVYPEVFYQKIVVAFCGAARTPIDEVAASEVIRKILEPLDPKKHVVVTGGYPAGIPYIAALVAKDMGFEVIAIVPEIIEQTGFRYQSDKLYGENIMKVGEDWADESYAFGKSLTLNKDESGVPRGMIYFIGGGFWTEIEYQVVRKLKIVMKFVSGFGGMSLAGTKIAKEKEVLHTDTADYIIGTINPPKLSHEFTNNFNVPLF